MPILSKPEIAAWPVGAKRPDSRAPKTALRQALAAQSLDTPFQMAGRHFAMGCVALEITQRCNLDCTLCYLSDESEAVRDLPMSELFRRIDRIRHDFGPNTNVQVTGGDPTLRKREELVEIVRYIRTRGMAPALFTNGIRATRGLLTDLAAAGLRDVAFHVDMTQERKGYASEQELNAVRRDYISRAEGLGLHIIFNTTLFDGNFHETEALARFFLAHGHQVRMASFQLQAETGRGVVGATNGAVRVDTVLERLNRAAGFNIGFDWPLVGHPDCNRYGTCLVSGDDKTALFDAPNLFGPLFEEAETLRLDRHRPWVSAGAAAMLAARRPLLAARAAGFGLRKLWALRRGLMKSKGRVNKLTFYVHNFMDAGHLDKARCEACVFMTATRDGPVSMCVHNAKRDAFISQPIEDGAGKTWRPIIRPAADLPAKRLKGRLKQEKRAQSAKAPAS